MQPAQGDQQVAPTKKTALPYVWMLLLLSGCLSAPTPATRYFLVDPQLPSVASNPTGPDVFVHPFETTELYQNAHLVVQKSRFEATYRAHHRWGNKPPHLMAKALTQILATSGVIGHVSAQLNHKPPMYELLGTLNAMDVETIHVRPDMHLDFELELREFQSHAIVWRYRFNKTRPLISSNSRDAAQALSELLENAATEIHAQLKETITPTLMQNPQ